jgi:hypothetical protein
MNRGPRDFLLRKRHGPMNKRGMRAFRYFPFLLACAGPVAAEPGSLGVFGHWGSFEKAGPRSCYAIARPYRAPRGGTWSPFAAIGYWPTRNLRSQVHFRLSRAKRPGSAVLLRIDDRTFQLLAGGRDAWAPDPAADALIVATMRSGVEMSVETRSTTGAQFRDSYRLQGAATAVDAAAIACAR